MSLYDRSAQFAPFAALTGFEDMISRKSEEQLKLFEEEIPEDDRIPETITWNLWHGCTKISTGCKNCYMYRRDESNGKDPSIVTKTQNFNLPIRTLRSGEYKGRYKIPSGSHIYTCFSSDFFHEDADPWREEAWDIIRKRSDCTFFMITKRPDRIVESLPTDWHEGWEHVTIAVTCENQDMADKRLPIYLALPMLHYQVMIEPMLTSVNLEDYFLRYRSSDKRPLIESVSVGGESGPLARPCDFDWVLKIHDQCKRYDVGFYYHQTGAKLIKEGKLYNIPRKLQHEQAHKAGLDFGRAN
jgi:protein gp37